jgi:hypothetical protein
MGVAIFLALSVLSGQSLFTCAPTPLEDRLPSAIASMAGAPPIWLVDGSAGLAWGGADVLIKSAWVLSRDASGDLRVEGRRLDAPGTLLFQDGPDGQPSPVLTITDPWGRGRSVRPGGASPEILRSYSFVMFYLIYPSRGCWDITARLGMDTVNIVREVR